MDKYLSIITNFGCHYSCPYCVVKNNNLHIPTSTMHGLSQLSQAIYENECNWVSISGGGDPLYNYFINKDWFRKFFEVIPNGIKTELHTSYITYDYDAYAPYSRVVYHLRNIDDIIKIKRYNGQTIRVVFVVTDDFTPHKIQEIYNLVKFNSSIDELSFRQMIDSNYNITHYCEEYLKAGHKKLWWYIEQNDYNIYYCENKIYTEYKKIGKEI